MSSDAESLQVALGLQRSGRLAEAERAYREILKREPRNVQALHLLALLAHQIRRPAEAIDCLKHAIDIDPNQAVLYNNLGEIHRSLNRLTEARACYDKALQLAPQLDIAHYNLGLLLHMTGDWAAAEREYETAIRLRPDYAEAHNYLGTLLSAQGKSTQAAAAFRAALACRPDYADALNGLGVTLQASGDTTQAQTCFERAVRLAPNNLAAQSNLALSLQSNRRPVEAQAAFERAVLIDPANPEMHFQLAENLQLQGKFDQAIDAYRKTLELDPQHAEAHYFLGTIHLYLGQFATGWPEIEWRGKSKFAGPQYPLPAWNGERLDGRQILLHAEGGLGDTLQFIRYVPWVRDRGGDVVLAVQKPLIPLLAQSGYSNLMPLADPPPATCLLRASLMSLPRIFGTTVDSIPADVPYLQANPQLVNYWRAKLPGQESFKVGIHWRGSAASLGDVRSFPLAEVEPLAAIPGVTLVSLQKHEGREELTTLQGRFAVVDFGDELDSQRGPFMDTAAIIKNLDLVVTCDTSVAHLAGVLGAPTWIALSLAPEWRWLTDRDDSPWYPSVRLFRQRAFDDWKSVFQAMSAALAALVSSA